MNNSLRMDYSYAIKVIFYSDVPQLLPFLYRYYAGWFFSDSAVVMRHEMMIQCGNCEKTGVELKTCGRCQSVAYCSLKCQVRVFRVLYLVGYDGAIRLKIGYFSPLLGIFPRNMNLTANK